MTQRPPTHLNLLALAGCHAEHIVERSAAQDSMSRQNISHLFGPGTTVLIGLVWVSFCINNTALVKPDFGPNSEKLWKYSVLPPQ
jgi:hypothetical protein